MAKPGVPDDLWEFVEPLLPRHPVHRRGGRPFVEDRRCLCGILWVLKTGIAWEDLPAEVGCSFMTCWRRLRDWQKAGVWDRLHAALLQRLADADALDVSRVPVDSSSVRALKKGMIRARTPRTGPDSGVNTISRSTPAARRWSRRSGARTAMT